MNPDQNDPKEEFRALAEQLGLKLEPWQIDILKAMDSEKQRLFHVRKTDRISDNFLDDPKLKEKFAVELAKIESERQHVQDQLAACERDALDCPLQNQQPLPS